MCYCLAKTTARFLTFEISGIIVKGVYELWGEGSTHEELEEALNDTLMTVVIIDLQLLLYLDVSRDDNKIAQQSRLPHPPQTLGWVCLSLISVRGEFGVKKQEPNWSERGQE
ncbi:hypothetical protein Acr_00g0050880 [Actinidia rufa]|uniref:Uncharacterized protein n=1 Tax=Actinidia rufa TaxID=165716 RepID=A0A7J0DLA8_9ERIC|nr:hypothetical protein Acr_00g0050880 [Actinidia rufa]